MAASLLALAFAFRLALIPLGLYRSTDFEVHRNWLAITHSLPFSKWYYEETSQWTLDYPPFFAFFEWVLSQAAMFADPEMLNVSNLGYASPATVVFQRCSVVAGDFVLLLGAHRLGLELGGAPGAAHAASIVLVGPALVLVDHVHFQYNGMLLGVLLLSIAELEADRVYSAAALFCVLLNMKQIFLYVAPVYFFYLLRGHCGCEIGVGPLGVRLRVPALLRLAAIVLGVFSMAWGPLLCTNQFTQTISRLFPFGRGLTHAYWAPNVWALYNTADRALAKLGFRSGGQAGQSSTGGFAEVYESSVLWTVPPKATFALALLAYVPLAVLIWRQTSPAAPSGEFNAKPRHRGHFAFYTSLGSSIAFAFGWHVHEKAILMVTVPLLAAAAGIGAAGGDKRGELREAVAALSVVGTFSVLPLLPQRPLETSLKWSLFVGGHILELRALGCRGFGSLRVWPLPGSLILLGIVVLGIYCDFGGHQLLFKGDMEFLPLMLISDFSAVVVLSSFARLFCIASRLPGHSSIDKSNIS
mmetsp:Transcript_37317/g.98371  ORF Transcript_37317/g.98371 Transcript_37317/m.98371 type:complete len:527 (+) Transcript_37317:93-1673(+)